MVIAKAFCRVRLLVRNKEQLLHVIRFQYSFLCEACFSIATKHEEHPLLCPLWASENNKIFNQTWFNKIHYGFQYSYDR